MKKREGYTRMLISVRDDVLKPYVKVFGKAAALIRIVERTEEWANNGGLGDLDSRKHSYVPKELKPPKPKKDPLVEIGIGENEFQDEWPRGGWELARAAEEAYRKGHSGFWDAKYTSNGQKVKNDLPMFIDVLEKCLDRPWEDITPNQWNLIKFGRDLYRRYLTKTGE